MHAPSVRGPFPGSVVAGAWSRLCNGSVTVRTARKLRALACKCNHPVFFEKHLPEDLGAVRILSSVLDKLRFSRQKLHKPNDG